MILLASPPGQGTRPPFSSLPLQYPAAKPHVAISRSIRRDPNYSSYAASARRSYSTILSTPPTPRRTPAATESYRSGSPMSNSYSPPSQRLGGWSGPGSISARSEADDALKSKIQHALSSLKLWTKVQERQELRRKEEISKQREERDVVERHIKTLLAGMSLGSPNHGGLLGSSLGPAGSSGGAGSGGSGGSNGGGSVNMGPGSAGIGGDDSVRGGGQGGGGSEGVPAQSEESKPGTPSLSSPSKATGNTTATANKDTA